VIQFEGLLHKEAILSSIQSLIYLTSHNVMTAMVVFKCQVKD